MKFLRSVAGLKTETGEEIRTKYVQFKCNYCRLWVQIDTIFVRDEIIHTFPS